MIPRGSIGKSHGLCHRLRAPSLALPRYSPNGLYYERRVESQKREGYCWRTYFNVPGTSFSCVSLSSFFAFKEGMHDTQTSALRSSPTVSGRFFLPTPPECPRAEAGTDFALPRLCP